MFSKMFGQYRGLRREMYILFFGRVVTNMGALIWPMLTLILKNKLGLSTSAAADFLLITGFLQLPCTLVGGKLADRFSKRNIIIVCDLVTVVSYIICFFLPVSFFQVGLFCIAGFFAQMEWPSYDALVADLSSSADRERAYSLSYLGGNLGMVLAPILGGFLFASHLNLAFLISGLATFSSTVLIFFFIHNTRPVREEGSASHYQQEHSGSTWQVLGQNKALLLFFLCSAVSQFIYIQFSFLLPLNLEQLYGAQGAVWFGLLTSVNATVVIFATPLLTGWCRKVRDTGKLMLGEGLIAVGFGFYIFVQKLIPLYFVSMVIFTLGEVLFTLGRQPYLTRRVPSSHRGRMASLIHIIGIMAQGVALKLMGILAEFTPMPQLWCLVVAAGLANLGAYGLLRFWDKKAFRLLYQAPINAPDET